VLGSANVGQMITAAHARAIPRFHQMLRQTDDKRLLGQVDVLDS
jgi:hypothetical protein